MKKYCNAQIVIIVTKLDSNLEIVFHNDVVNALP
jgi:hypothetical protein